MKGKLLRWNDEKGFGFIRPSDGGQDVFVHISALKRMARRPMVGDAITFEVHRDNDGKQRAVNARIDGVASVRAARQPPRTRSLPRRGGLIGKLVALALVLGLGVVVYGSIGDLGIGRSESSHSMPAVSPTREIRGRYRCDGRTRCTEMTSCDEAKFFIQNCPRTKMDGDGDGVPCESQWCSG